MDKKQAKDIALNGLVINNPTFRLVLGTCPTLALSTKAFNGVGMGLAVIFILICSNVLISLLRKIIPSSVRIPAYVLIIATFVTIVRMVMEKFMPSLFDALGVFLPLIVVNCVILGRAEGFANKNTVFASALDGLFTGLGFALALTLIGSFREIFGNGTFFDIRLWNFKIAFFTSPAGAFFVYGAFIAAFNALYTFAERKSRRKNFFMELVSDETSAEPNAETEEA